MPTPPDPKKRSAPALPVSSTELLMRALAQVIRTAPGSPFKQVTRDLIQEAMLPDAQLPAVVFDDSRLTIEYQDAHNKDRIAQVSGVIVFDVQGSARSHGARELGFKVGETRNALVQALALILYNNRRMVTTLADAGEAAPTAHCINIGARLEVQHVPEAAPLTRSLVSASVLLVESLDQRDWAIWTPGVLEGAPLAGGLVEAPLDPPEE